MKYEFKDEYEWIRVIDSFPENHRYLHFEGSIQGAINLSALHQPVLEYVGLMAEGARFLNVLPKSVLLGGLGSCGLLHALSWWWRRQALIQTVEISQRIHQIAHRFFRLRSSEAVILGDLRQLLEEGLFPQTDLILVDCYTAASIPPHLTTLQFMELLSNNMSEVGACAFNIWSPECNELCGDQLRTMLEVFGKVGIVVCHEDQNLIAFVRKDPREDWPGSLMFNGRRYNLQLFSQSFKQNWPEHLREGRTITDENMGFLFQALMIDTASEIAVTKGPD